MILLRIEVFYRAVLTAFLDAGGAAGTGDAIAGFMVGSHDAIGGFVEGGDFTDR